MIKILLSVLLLISFCSFGLAQQNCPEIEGNPHPDEYINVPFSIEKRRLDEAAKALKSFPKKSVYLVVYGQNLGKKSKAILRVKKAEQHLIKTHNIQKKRITVIPADTRDWLEMKIFIVDSNLKEQPCNDRIHF